MERIVEDPKNTKCGLEGILDPFASGLVLIGVGYATKFFSFFASLSKTYEAVLLLGKETDTLDPTGIAIKSKPVPPLSGSKIISIFSQFIGKTKQKPPIYSNVKINGRPARKLAREGTIVELNKKEVYVHDLRLSKFDSCHIHFECCTSKGVYIRSLGRDIAEALGTVGHLIHLNRSQIGKFSIKQIEDSTEENAWMKKMSIAEALYWFPEIHLENKFVTILRRGQSFPYPVPNGIYKLNSQNIFAGLVEAQNGMMKPRKMIFDRSS